VGGVNISGVLRIDLGPFVDYVGSLYLGDDEVRSIYRAAGGFVGPAILDIGAAKRLDIPDRRIVECLAGIESLTLVGTDARGVVQAQGAIRAILTPAQRGPEVVR
jgi:hypothetical protein